MQIAEREVGAVTVLDLSGKITLGEGDALLKDKLHSLLHRGKKTVLLNLAEVSYVDSAGLGALVSAYTTVTREGGSLKLANVTKKLQDLLSITKLLTVFESYDDEARSAAQLQELGNHSHEESTEDQKFRRNVSSDLLVFCFDSVAQLFRNTTIRFVFVPFALFLIPQQLAVFVNC